MADFERKLTKLAERGHRVGPEDLIERVEAALAEDPLVVVTKQRKGWQMSVKTDENTEGRQSRRARGIAWGIALFMAIIAFGTLLIALNQVQPDVATPSPPTTVVTDATVSNALDADPLAIATAGIEAWYGGDYEAVAEMFILPFSADEIRWSAEAVRDMVAYQAAIGGELTGACEMSAPTTYTCSAQYENEMTKAMGVVCCDDESVSVEVEDGRIVWFNPPEHAFVNEWLALYMASLGTYEDLAATCLQGYDEDCARVQLDHLGGFADWYATITPASVVEQMADSWTNGDCLTFALVSAPWDPILRDVSPDAECAQTELGFHKALGAGVEVIECEQPGSQRVFCELSYSNVLHERIGQTATGSTVPIEVSWLPYLIFDAASVVELLDFPTYGSEVIGEEYVEVCSASRLDSTCADLVLEHIDDWAAWHQASS